MTVDTSLLHSWKRDAAWPRHWVTMFCDVILVSAETSVNQTSRSVAGRTLYEKDSSCFAVSFSPLPHDRALPRHEPRENRGEIAIGAPLRRTGKYLCPSKRTIPNHRRKFARWFNCRTGKSSRRERCRAGISELKPFPRIRSRGWGWGCSGHRVENPREAGFQNPSYSIGLTAADSGAENTSFSHARVQFPNSS